MRSSSEGCSFIIVVAIIISAIETTLCIFIGVKSKDPTHPFYYMQKMNFVFYLAICVLLVVSGLNLLPMAFFTLNSDNVPHPILKLLSSRIFVILLTSCFHFIACSCLFSIFITLEFYAIAYFSIKDYPTNDNVKGFIDSVQSTLNCCGKTIGYRDWNGSMPYSCCNYKSCSVYHQYWPCFPMFRYTLGSPILVSLIVIFLCVWFNLFNLWSHHRNTDLNLFSFPNDDQPIKPASVHHPMLPIRARSPPCYVIQNDMEKMPFSDKNSEKSKARHKVKKLVTDIDRIDPDAAIRDALCGSGYRKFGSSSTIHDAQHDNSTKKRISFSLPSERRRQTSTSSMYDVSEALTRDLSGAMEDCISQKVLERMSDGDFSAHDDVSISKVKNSQIKPQERKMPAVKEKKKEKSIRHSERQIEASVPVATEEAKSLEKVQKRATSPLQKLKDRLKKRKDKKDADEEKKSGAKRR